MRRYVARTRTSSLFHTLLRRAEHIGHHDPARGFIQWYAFAPWTVTDPLTTTLNELRKEPSLWRVLGQHCGRNEESCYKWLFALCMMSQPASEKWLRTGRRSRGRALPAKVPQFSYQDLYAHLLYFKDIEYWTLETTNLLVDLQRQLALDHIVRQYAYVHRSVRKESLSVYGQHPGLFVRRALSRTEHVSFAPKTATQSKKTMAPEEMHLVRMYGLAPHHLEDALECIGGVIQ